MISTEPVGIAQLPRRSMFERLVYRIMPPRRPEDRTCPPGLDRANMLYGWFDNCEDMSKPTYAPPAGAPCVLCGRRVAIEDATLVDLPYSSVKSPWRVFFYITHAACIEAADDPLHLIDVENAVFAMIARNGD